MDTKQCILVIDDEETVRGSLASWLEEDGYEVDLAPDGPGGLVKLQAKRYTVLLVDLKMPGMDGLEVLARARRIQPEVPLIIMTAYATVETAVQAMKLGAYDYLVKPFEPDELSLMVGKLTSPQTPRRENTSGQAAVPARGAIVAAPGTHQAGAPPSVSGQAAANGTGAESLRDVERRHIEGTLKQHGWNISRSAKALGIDRVTLYNKIRKYHIREDEGGS